MNQEQYGALVVPYSQYLPERVIDAFERLSNEGLPVFFVDGMPDMTSEMREIGERLQTCGTLPLEELSEQLIRRGHRSVRPEMACETLRFYHIERAEIHFFQFWNEDLFQTIDTWVELPVSGAVLFYEGWKNRLFLPEQKESAEGKKTGIRLHLAPAASVLVCVEGKRSGELSNFDGEISSFDYGEHVWKELSLEWEISMRDADREDFVFYRKGELCNLARELPDFAGVLRYEATVSFDEGEKVSVLDLGRVGETAQLWVNGTYYGACVSEPYCFEVKEQIHAGQNVLCVEVMNNLGYRGRDSFSEYLPLPPTGLLGPVKIG